MRVVAEDPRAARLILMNSAQAHFPDVTWLIETFPQSKPAFTSTSRSVQAQMCARGLGVAVLPRPLGEQIGGLHRIDGFGQPPGRDIWVGYHQDLRQMDQLRALLEIAERLLPNACAVARRPSGAD
ncbi:LysR substrate-binding domain-containing protein [Stenotrophomonas sp.]|uniref:LysR substrate-binding domain-containing protein n=1 Tax=Stenotrophomonas sp. TaxID=69392 RepID=UPI0028B0FA19|nr:LysR substrate-binding domain-containing protein [Stenotrophomonas sp.]